MTLAISMTAASCRSSSVLSRQHVAVDERGRESEYGFISTISARQRLLLTRSSDPRGRRGGFDSSNVCSTLLQRSSAARRRFGPRHSPLSRLPGTQLNAGTIPLSRKCAEKRRNYSAANRWKAGPAGQTLARRRGSDARRVRRRSQTRNEKRLLKCLSLRSLPYSTRTPGIRSR